MGYTESLQHEEEICPELVPNACSWIEAWIPILNGKMGDELSSFGVQRL